MNADRVEATPGVEPGYTVLQPSPPARNAATMRGSPPFASNALAAEFDKLGPRKPAGCAMASPRK